MKVSDRIPLPAEPGRAWDTLERWEEQPRWMRDAASVRVLGARREGVRRMVAVRARPANVPAFTERGLLLRAYRPFLRRLMRASFERLRAEVAASG